MLITKGGVRVTCPCDNFWQADSKTGCFNFCEERGVVGVDGDKGLETTRAKRCELLRALAVLVLSAAVLVQAAVMAKMRAEIKELWFRHGIIREEIESLYAARYRLENTLREMGAYE